MSHARKLIEFFHPVPIRPTPTPALKLKKRGPDTREPLASFDDRAWAVSQNQKRREVPKPAPDRAPLVVAESLVRGEYWIYQDGDVHYCDGDIGDENHEGHALSQAISILSDHLAIDSEALVGDDLYQAIVDALADDVEDGDPDASDDPEPLASVLLARLKVPQDVIDAAFNRVDLRRYACEKWGWSALRGTHIETWAITPEKLKVIARGVDNVLDSEGVEADAPELETLAFHISAFVKGGGRIEVTYAQLQSGEFERPTPVPAAPAKNAQVRAMDVQATPPTYKGKLGDSVDAFLR